MTRFADLSFAAYLAKIAFPQSREAIVRLAEENVEDMVLLAHLRAIPAIAYNSIEDIRKALDEEYENYGMVKKNAEKMAQTNPTLRN